MWVARHACEEEKVSARATCKRVHLEVWEVRMSASHASEDIGVSDERRHLHAAEERRRQGTG